MSHPTHSYAPLDSTPPNNPDITATESHYQPSSPPPLYSNSRGGSNSPPRGAGGYRPESMLYTKHSTSPSLSTTSEASLTALLSKYEHENEKDHTSESLGSDLRSISPVRNTFHYKGKRWLSVFRTLFALFNILVSIVAFVMIAIVIWGIYAKDKDNWQQPTSNPKDPNKPHPNRTYAFPQAIEPLPSNLILAASLFATVLNTITVFAPCWRSNKKFHKKRFAKSEIFEIIGNIIVVGAGAAGCYFAISTKSNLEHSLWGFTCDVTGNPAKYPQARLFAEIKYPNACNNYNAAVYSLLAVVALSAVTLGTFLINICLRKKRGEYRHDDSAFCVGVCDCCGACAGPLTDCAICCECCCICFQLCS
ncbi:hypothetical protein TWF281_001030 [Arthrobotrys megalospora]